MTQSEGVPPGSGALRVAPFAAPGPALATVTVKPTGSPALTVVASADFVTLRFGHWTVTAAMLLLPPVPLVVVTEAWFFTTPQSAGAVDELMWIAGSEPGPTWLKVQSSTWLPTAPVIEHPAYAGLSGPVRVSPDTPSAH